jgi:rod shape-determining protein MreD
VRTAIVLVALCAALVVQTTLSGMIMGSARGLDLVLIAIVYLALAYGPVTGMLAGTAGGLAQDALAGGIIGIGGLTNTLVGFLVGFLGAQFIVAQTLSRFLMFVAATFAHELLFEGLHALIEVRRFVPNYPSTAVQSGLNAVLGVTIFWVVEKGPTVLQNRRMRRASFGKRRF